MIKNHLKFFNVLKDDEIGNLIQLSAKKTSEEVSTTQSCHIKQTST